MDSYLDGEIVPGERVGDFYIGWSLEELKSNIDFNYTISETKHMYILENESIRFFVVKKIDFLQQITLFGGYRGKLFNCIGIGSILANTKEEIPYELDEEDNDCTYYLKDYKGINFDLKRGADDTTPIQYISVYKGLDYEQIV